MKQEERWPDPSSQSAAKSEQLDPSLVERSRQFRQAPSADEIARRTEAVRELFRLRDALPPLDISVTELLRRVREEEDARLDV